MSDEKEKLPPAVEIDAEGFTCDQLRIFGQQLDLEEFKIDTRDGQIYLTATFEVSTIKLTAKNPNELIP